MQSRKDLPVCLCTFALKQDGYRMSKLFLKSRRYDHWFGKLRL